MNLSTVLPCLMVSGFLGAQVVELKPTGGGDLKIGDAAHRFVMETLSSAPPKGGLPGALRLEGNLIPQDGSRPFRMVLTVLKDGTLYMLKIERKAPGSYPDTWAATLKTRVRALRLEDGPGGRIELRCEGPLTGIIAQRPVEATWSGSLWAAIPKGADEAPR